MFRLLIMLFLFPLSPILCAQENQEQEICLKLVYGDERIDLDDGDFISDGIRIETLKFFLGQIQLYRANHPTWIDPQSYHLVDASQPQSLCISFSQDQVVEFDEVRFTFGVDSTTSASGVFGGDLDPTNGMYWAWHSGYINFKLEGEKIKEDKSKQIFNFHLGGFLAPYYNAQMIELPLKTKGAISIKLDIESILNQIDISDMHTVMSPSAKAVEMSKLISSSMSIDE